MILFREYKEHPSKDGYFLDRVWYDSSNIVYSECEDKEGENKTLRVVFNNGSMYEYKDVDVNDYVMFVHGGIDQSNGKAFFKYIKGKKYEYARLEDIDKSKISEEMNLLIEQKKKQEAERAKENEEKRVEETKQEGEENASTNQESNIE